FTQQFVDDPLQQEIPEADSPQTRLSIGNRIEDCPARLASIVRRHLGIEQYLYIAGHLHRECDLDENERYVFHAGMEEGIATAVACHSVLEFLPGPDLV